MLLFNNLNIEFYFIKDTMIINIIRKTFYLNYILKI